jgi:hypothetical protein
MAIADIFSKRQKRERGEVIDVFTYDEIPNSLRVQIVHIWTEAFELNKPYQNNAYQYFELAHNLLSREYGVFSLVNLESQNSNSNLFNNERTNYEQILRNFLLSCNDNEKVLDVIEIICRFISFKGSEASSQETFSYEEAIKELNLRFIEHGIGYQFESGQIIRKDSELFHQEAVKPVLNFLISPEYTGANEEFLKAHEHYRHQRYKECLNECLKSFESVMKIICDKHNWIYDQNDTAKKLIQICFDNNLIPSFLHSLLL